MVKVELFEGLSFSEFLAQYLSKSIVVYVFTFIWVSAGLSKFIKNDINVKNWPIINDFFWKIAGLTEVLIGAAIWLAPDMPWTSVYSSYFMLGCIFCFLAFIPDKQGPGGISPLDRDGAFILIPIIVILLLTNLFAFHHEVDPSKYRIFCIFAGIANAFSVNNVAMMIKKMNSAKKEE
jgi:hypothetical protein